MNRQESLPSKLVDFFHKFNSFRVGVESASGFAYREMIAERLDMRIVPRESQQLKRGKNRECQSEKRR